MRSRGEWREMRGAEGPLRILKLRLRWLLQRERCRIFLMQFADWISIYRKTLHEERQSKLEPLAEALERDGIAAADYLKLVELKKLRNAQFHFFRAERGIDRERLAESQRLLLQRGRIPPAVRGFVESVKKMMAALESKSAKPGGA
jgi:hypothetical protein